MSEHLNRRITALEHKVSHLERINTPRQEHTTSDRPQNASEQHGDTTPRQSPSLQQIPATPKNPQQTPDPWYKTLQGWYYLFGTVAIPFAIGYAVVTWYQWRDLRSNFKIDQRAWFSITEVTRPSLTANEAMPARIGIVNTGKTPGTHVVASIYIEVVRNGDSPHFDSLRFGYIGYTGLLLPNSPITVPALRQRHKNNGGEHEAEDDPLTQKELESLVRGDAWVATHGVVRYRDIFQVEHWTKFCFWSNPLHAGDYSAGSCTTYNAVDDNQ